MIFSNNRSSSLGDIEIETNESYLGFGAINFMQECYENELEIFKAGIASDIEEAAEGDAIDAEFTEKEDKGDKKSSSSESSIKKFIKQAQTRLQEMMKKLIQWIDSVVQAALKKYDSVIIKQNEKFCKEAESRLSKANKEDLKVPKKYFKASDTSKAYTEELESVLKKAGDSAKSGDLERIKAYLEEVNKKSVKDFIDTNSEEGKEGANVEEIVKRHIAILRGSRPAISELRKTLKQAKADASQIHKNAKKLSGSKEEVDNKIKAAATYQQLCKKVSSLALSILSQEAKAAKTVINNALSGVVKEGEELDTEFLIGLAESIDYEVEEAFGEMSIAEGDDCEDCEDDDFEEKCEK